MEVPATDAPDWPLYFYVFHEQQYNHLVNIQYVHGVYKIIQGIVKIVSH